jgi:predicted helicase
MILFEPEVQYDSKDRIPNIDKNLYEKLNKTYKKKLTPEEILYYIYSIFYSNYYRKKYSEFLKIDFPRVPFTADYKIFNQMAGYGETLANLHLVKDKAFGKLLSKYQGDGENNRVEKVEYNENEQRVYINPDKYFENIAPEVWNYQIGGYRVLKKYLDDRKKAGKEIGDEKHYNKIVTAIAKTLEIQTEIDKLYPEVEKELIEW